MANLEFQSQAEQQQGVTFTSHLNTGSKLFIVVAHSSSDILGGVEETLLIGRGRREMDHLLPPTHLGAVYAEFAQVMPFFRERNAKRI